MTAVGIAKMIESRHHPSGTELALQDSIAALLTERGVAFEREAILSPQDRPDFMVGDVAVEVKISGSTNAVERQLERYAAHERVKEIVLFTSRMQLARVPTSINGKPVRVAVQFGGL